ncbi:GNAT family N-acetyltransferase [Gymnodinialimonas sp. 2305UL16-5]|uniref:GNAT family N-acetyltransferase n=1 Tax=Gymnodinialimonas mytili TaxID=3126503 RepID=UPI0030B3E7DE
MDLDQETVHLREAVTEADFDAARALCWAYRDVLLGLGGRDAAAVLHFYPEEEYSRLMAALGRYHAPPEGAILLAWKGDRAVGCGMVHTLSPGVAEIKRVYVSDAVRGQGVGRAVMEALITLCRERGFKRILMDTGRKLQSAIALYDQLGFVRRGPYYELPEDVAALLVFFEMEL